ncbi:MAG: acetate--CoA ligase [Bacteroidota bacterium]|jgi:acetyl-CoA synthetase
MKRISTMAEYQMAHQKSIQDPQAFWGEIAETFEWKKKWENVISGSFSEARIQWFSGGQLNITENALDRHLKDKGEQLALIWEANDPATPSRSFTYSALHHEVCIAAAMLKKLGVKKGDRVCIYMGMVPELTISVLACARIGAIHSVIFGGFSAKSISDRIQDAQAQWVITMDAALRGNKSIALKPLVDEALQDSNTVEKVLVYNYLNTAYEAKDIDIDWDTLRNEVVQENNFLTPAEAMESEDPLFILYTSGSTGKPKGVVHSTAGYMIWTAYTFLNVFQYEAGQVHFCTADVGWITGHSYLIYGPLLNGATTVMFEGIPTYPDAGRFWDIVKKHNVNIFYTAPTAIRSLMSQGNEWLEGKDLSSLKVLGTVGEPINEEAWQWYHDEVGKGKCPIVDTFWQTETGGIMISSLAGVTPQKPVFATLPMPGVHPVLLDEKGQEIMENDITGNLCFKSPWPSMIRTTYGDHERCIINYFSTYHGYYFTGDGAYRDEQGMYRLTGRVDDVLNVSGHRIGTAEVENAINHTPDVIESAVVGYPHDIKGQGIFAFVICDNHHQINIAEKKLAILQTVSQQIGAIAKPDQVLIVSGLPKTRSGKIMRRILRKIAEGEFEAIGDTTSLLDPNIVQEIIMKIKNESY